jgi:signal transduction histidine kinase
MQQKSPHQFRANPDHQPNSAPFCGPSAVDFLFRVKNSTGEGSGPQVENVVAWAQLERDREEAARAAVDAEPARIARELHDLVAHSMGVMVIQAQAAQRVLRIDPAATEQALTSIEVTGRQGLAEMRRLLDVLVGTEETAPLAPQPALRHLDTLLDQVRAAGLPVEVSLDGSESPLPPGVDLSAYRIVQEALTNTLRHAGPAHARVRLHYHHDCFDVEVVDDGTTTTGSDNTGGHGLIGMRERVALYGGTLHTGHQPEGGYLVRAHLPFDVADTRPT